MKGPKRLPIDESRSESESSRVVRRRFVRSSWLACTLAFGCALSSGTARAAEDRDAAAAEALFQEGRARLEAGDIAAACSMLAESLRLDPATGTLLALAACHEKEGKLASAWAEFTDAAGRAAQEGNDERQQLALGRAEQLKPRLSTLTVRISREIAATPGLTIVRSNRTLGVGEWNVPLPVDGGSYTIEISAPGRIPGRLAIEVPAEGGLVAVDVPALGVEPRPKTPAISQPVKLPPPPPSTLRDRGLSRLEWVGISGAGVGVVSLGVGGYFLAQMLSKKAEADPNCDGPKNNECNDEGIPDQSDAAHYGRLATGFGIVGGVLVATGASLFLVGRSTRDEPPQVAVTLAPGGGALHFKGAF
jgi:hypothetical protein